MRGLLLACLLAACGPAAEDTDLAPLGEDCPDALVDDVITCVEDWLGDPDNTLSSDELVEACSDAEPLADAWDAFCATADPRPLLCDASYEVAWTTVREPCASEATAALAD